MTSAFCPGHLTCFFRPVRTADVTTTGSEGVGMRLSLGSTVHVDERTDGKVCMTIDGKKSKAKVTARTANILAGGRGFDITVENELSVSQGFGMSAAGAIAAGLCICKIIGKDENEAYKAAHMADIEEMGGLGDVSGLMANGPVSVRIAAGLPPNGNVTSKGCKRNLTLIVIDGKLETKNILSDSEAVKILSSAGEIAMKSYLFDGRLFKASRYFSASAKLESPTVRSALSDLGGNAAMCMLGNSIFTTLSEDEVKDTLGHDVLTYSCRPTSERAVIRKA